MEYSSGKIMEFVINKTWVEIEDNLYHFKPKEIKNGGNWNKGNGLYKPKIIIPSVRG